MKSLDLAIANGFLAVHSPLTPKVDLKADSKPASLLCQIDASNDLEAVFKWVQEYAHQKNTYIAYKREALKFLLWCTYERGKILSDLRKEDLEAYFSFLQKPPEAWCTSKVLNTFKEGWKPFRGPLSQSAFLTSVRILNSLFNYLVQAEYLRANPIKLIKKYAKLSGAFQEQKYQVWTRILEPDEWQALQAALLAMPEGSSLERDNKMRTQFLFALLYLLGVRIHEVVHHVWGDFRQRNDQFPVNDQLLAYIKAYRQYLNKRPFPEPGETESLLISKKTGKGLKITQLYSLVKAMGEEAARSFANQPQKQQKLKALSPHWLRHLAASHQDRVGIPLAMIKDNLRHQSSQTTQIYVHAEEEERFQQMQKMQMNAGPSQIHLSKKVMGIEYRLILEKGPVNKAMGLSRLLAGIEKQIFKNVEWIWLGEPKEALLDRVKRAGAQCTNIEISYQVKSKEQAENTPLWVDALKRQCEIWLFACSVQTREIEEP